MGQVRSILAWSLAAALVAPCAAQSFNVDMAIGLSVPAAGYAAAAGQPGFWNGVPNPYPNAFALKGLAGEATEVTLKTTGGMDLMLNVPPNGSKTSGNDQRLMDDIWDPGGGVPGGGTIRLDGMSPGFYTVFVYASAPDDISYRTGVRVNGSDILFIGGNWPRPVSFAAPITHAGFAAEGGSDRVLTIEVAQWIGYSSVNGFQVIRAGTFCRGDLDGDGRTDQSDLGILLSAYLTCPGDPFYVEAAGLLVPDDPCVTQADLGLLLADYPCAPP